MMNDYLIPSTKARIERIREEVPKEEIYKNLAEEASELAQAALKMCRIASTTNPTDKSADEVYENLIEEYTDVLNTADRILELKPNWLIGDFKLYRWCIRLDEMKKENQNGIL